MHNLRPRIQNFGDKFQAGMISQEAADCGENTAVVEWFNQPAANRFPGSSTVEHSAVNRQAVGSNPTRGANLRFLSQLDVARTFGSSPKG